jgi:hypothetical protein
MGSFHRVDTSQLKRGAGRIMYAPDTQPAVDSIDDVIVTAAGGTQYDAKSGWVDLGATRDGIAIEVNNTESGFNIDQISAQVGTAPDQWSCTVTTALAEMTLEHLVIAWEGSAIQTNTTPTPDERQTGFAGATSYTERRLAILFKNPDDSLMLFYFHRAVRAPQAVTISFVKTGDAMTIPAQWTILADDSQTDPRDSFGFIFEQIAA